MKQKTIFPKAETIIYIILFAVNKRMVKQKNYFSQSGDYNIYNSISIRENVRQINKMNVVNKVKDKLGERRFKKLETKIIRLQGERSKLHEQQENLGTTETITDSVDKECDTAMKKKTKKRLNKKTGHNKGEGSSKTIRPDGLGCEKQVQPIYSVNEGPVKRPRKRCHFCRKRGHLQKDCLSKHMLRKWLRDEASEMYQNTLQ